MDVKELAKAIQFGNFTNNDINQLVDAIKFARARLTRNQTRALRVGDTVKFTSTRNGVTYTGTIDKVKVKFVLVNTPQGRYNVPASMLEAI